MNLLFAVIDDLYQFALHAVMVVARAGTKEQVLPVRTPVLPPTEQVLDPDGVVPLNSSPQKETIQTEPVHDEVHLIEQPRQTFRPMGAILAEKIPETVSRAEHTVMYAGSVSVPFFEHPTRAFDTIIGHIGYGEMAVVLEEKGKYVRIASGVLEGWTLREDLVDRAAYVYPDFTIGEENDVDDPNTIRVRAMLDDTFGGALVEYPLQAGEYVSYKLLRKGIHIDWPKTRPRIPGFWHVILKGVSGIHIGIAPKTGSLMEYMLPGEIGHLAYVEAVFPDETITISEANFPHGGIYNERVITREEWRELRPLFIQIA